MRYLENILHISDDILGEFVQDNVENLVFDTYKPSGGQVAGWGDQSVRLKQLSSGITVDAGECRSQHQNRKLALLKLIIKIYEQ